MIRRAPLVLALCFCLTIPASAQTPGRPAGKPGEKQRAEEAEAAIRTATWLIAALILAMVGAAAGYFALFGWYRGLSTTDPKVLARTDPWAKAELARQTQADWDPAAPPQ